MNWIAGFRTGHLSAEDEERSERTTHVTVPENMDALRFIILDDRRISAEKVAETLVISQERVGYIIHKRKISTKCLSAGQKCDRVLALQAILDQFW
jgi:hypothetical protein